MLRTEDDEVLLPGVSKACAALETAATGETRAVQGQSRAGRKCGLLRAQKCSSENVFRSSQLLRQGRSILIKQHLHKDFRAKEGLWPSEILAGKQGPWLDPPSSHACNCAKKQSAIHATDLESSLQSFGSSVTQARKEEWRCQSKE